MSIIRNGPQISSSSVLTSWNLFPSSSSTSSYIGNIYLHKSNSSRTLNVYELMTLLHHHHQLICIGSHINIELARLPFLFFCLMCRCLMLIRKKVKLNYSSVGLGWGWFFFTLYIHSVGIHLTAHLPIWFDCQLKWCACHGMAGEVNSSNRIDSSFSLV